MGKNPTRRVRVRGTIRVLTPQKAAANFCRHCNAVTYWIHLGFQQDDEEGVTTGTGITTDKPILLCTGCETVVIVQRSA